MQVCTIIAKNYVAHARVLARSLAEHNPDSRLWTLVIDDHAGYIDPADEPFEVLSPADIGCEPFTYMALRYTVLELSTAVKPWLLRHLLGRTGGPVTYLDPDIKVYGSLARLDELAGRHGVALIPHNNTPLPPDGRKPSQIDVMIAGVYNLGYVSLAPRPEVEDLLDWWADRLRRDCRVDPVWGYFVDQRWFDLVPGFLEDFAIVRDPEFNVAYWNLHSRRLDYDGEHYLVDGRPLAFFHFSGFDAALPLRLSLHQNRIDVTEHSVLERLLAEYSADVLAQGHRVSRHWPYSYRTLGDGTEIDELVRSLCEQFDDEIEERGAEAPSPFTLAGAQALQAWMSESPPGAPRGINRVVARLYEDRRDLQAAFPDLEGEDRQRLLTWAREIGPAELPLLEKLATANGSGAPEVQPDPGEASTPTPARQSLEPLPEGVWGVNLVGYFHSAGSLGEAARQLVGTFDASGVPSAPIEDPTSRREDILPYPTVPAEGAPYQVNLICSAPDTLAGFVAQAGQRFFAGRYSIALWSSDATPARELVRAVEEFWVPSAYVAEAVGDVGGMPVHVVPIPIAPPAFDTGTRRAAGLPEDEFLFILSVEDGEELERRNPEGAIEAFSRAFDAEAAARLVISCGRRGPGDGALERLQAIAANHPRVQVIEAPPTRAGAIGLLALSDCYVSLHRAEPFGMSMAEAMWLGKPVIATGYSGNLEYMTAANSLLVEYASDRSDPRSVWAEPDLGHAARLMRQVFEDPASARALGEHASADVRRRYSTTAAAPTITRRLESIRTSAHVPRRRSTPNDRPRALAAAAATVSRGPSPVPPPGSAYRMRATLRKAALRAVRPFSAYQRRTNLDLLRAIEELNDNVAALRLEASTERAQLAGELRGSRQLRAALEVQARGLVELRRMLTLQTDRGLYLALSELARRHQAIGRDPGAPPTSLSLAPYELQGYSQNGEDGALVEIFRRIGAENRYFVEFGVESGIEGNCVYLADLARWHGLFMEADDRFYRLLARKYSPRPEIRTLQALVSPENIERLLEEAQVPSEPDVMSIDVDGQDYWIWDAIENYRPRVVVIEYNSSLDPHRRLVQPKEVTGWDGTDHFGASVGAVRSLGDHKGYRLVHTELAGSNAFFVREDLSDGRFLDPDEIQLRGIPNYFQSGYRHPPDEQGRRYLDLDTGQMAAAWNASSGQS